MRLRQAAAICVAMVLMAGTASVTAFAHGHGGYRGTAARISPQYAYCSVQNCALTGIHKHDGVSYYAHHAEDGHAYHSQNYYYKNHSKGYHH